ncbi:GDSL-type esterase/lipase family protein [Methylobacterium sp. B1]|uniref:SGNH/GDSL hydrolase family protein n=1 Tax=Methylobacterium sp. B1 TaxID=91459 RepID=UPI0003467AFB|nr:GDSL-type esterase/lipase family protein [Methylobacterium sp. B1]
MSKSLNFAFPARKLLRRLGLLSALLVLPTAVLAYADLLPESLDMLGLDLRESPDLPHVARQIAIGAPLKIVAFGSSSTQGIGASSPANAYPARLQIDLRKKLHGIDVAVINRGIGGEHVDDMLARLDRDVIAAEPQLVIWQTGSNDPLRGVSVEHFREATVSAIRRIREAGIDVVLMEPQWCPKLEATPGASRFRDAVRSIGDDLDVPVIRRADLMHGWVREGKLTTKQLFAADGLHMADRGYALLAEAAAQSILQDAGPVRSFEPVAE